MIKTEDIPGKIMEVKRLISELEESELCNEHDNPDVRVAAQDSIMDMQDSLDDFIRVFTDSL